MGELSTMLRVGDVWEGLTGKREGCPPQLIERVFSATVIDSRSVTPGALFVALKGERTDGHLYLQDAFNRGALAAIVEAKGIRDSSLPIAEYLVVNCADGRIESPGSEAHDVRLLFVAEESLASFAAAGRLLAGTDAGSDDWITGSVGKTTTKEIVANVAGAALRHVAK